MGETLADAIRARLADTGESQQTVADRFGIAQPSFGRWIAGVTAPSDQHIAALARWLKRPRAEVADLAAASRESIRLRAHQDETRRRAQADVPDKLDRILDDLARIKAHLGIE